MLPFLPTPPTSSLSARSKRTDPSSSSEDGLRRPFGISNVKYRVGAPPLRPLPLRTSEWNPLLNAQPPFPNAADLENELITTAYEVLRRHDVLRPWSEVETIDDPYDDRVSLTSRLVPGDPEISEPTLLIVAPWNNASGTLWERAVKEIKRAVNDRMQSLDRADFEMTVEIIAPQLVMQKYVGLILDQPRLEAAWPTLGQHIFHLLESFESTRSHMTNISLLRLGYSRDEALNPITVYVSVRYESNETGWSPVVGAIKNYLHESSWFDINVHMEHNTSHQHIFQLNPPAHIPNQPQGLGFETLVIEGDYPQRANMGADIGACTYLKRNGDGKLCNPMMGTLGCYIQVKTGSNSSWTTYALTCHHVVRPCTTGFAVEKHPSSQSSAIGNPIPGSLLEKFDLDGRFPRNSNDDGGIESPTRLKHNATVDELKVSLANGNNFVQPELAQKLAFFDRGHQVLGKVWLSSGYARRTSGGNRLDWALVSINSNRLGMNMLPSYSSWKSKYPPQNHPHASTYSTILRPPGQISIKALSAATKVFKVGASSGVASGYFSRFKSAVSINEDSYMVANRSSTAKKNWMSWEYAYKGNLPRSGTSPLGLSGDSGAVVFDESGAALGLSFTGLRPQQSYEGLTYITPIEEIFDDIKSFSQGNITDIRIA